jgi:hypothetical protein
VVTVSSASISTGLPRWRQLDDAAYLSPPRFSPYASRATSIIHYALAENLEHVDVALIDTAAIPASKSEAG